MPAVLKRTAWAKTLGLLVSLAWFIAIVISGQYENNPMLAWGILLWYPMIGAMVWLAWVMDKHPLLGKMGTWRGAMIWAFMNLILVLVAYQPLMMLAQNMGYNFSTNFVIFWAMFEWALIAWAIDWYVTAKFGEGKKLMKK